MRLRYWRFLQQNSSSWNTVFQSNFDLKGYFFAYHKAGNKIVFLLQVNLNLCCNSATSNCFPNYQGQANFSCAVQIDDHKRNDGGESIHFLCNFKQVYFSGFVSYDNDQLPVVWKHLHDQGNRLARIWRACAWLRVHEKKNILFKLRAILFSFFQLFEL